MNDYEVAEWAGRRSPLIFVVLLKGLRCREVAKVTADGTCLRIPYDSGKLSSIKLSRA